MTEHALRYFSEDQKTIGAECPDCERVLKVYKRGIKENEGGFEPFQAILCPCGQSYTQISVEPGKRNKTASIDVGPSPRPNDRTDDFVKCRRCGSTQITGQKKGFGVGKALGGGFLLGPLGLLGGFLGSRKVLVTCLKCGHQWRP
jgi:hypothetical protein